MRSQRWLLIILVLCVTACTYVAQLQYGLNSALNAQARELHAGSSDQAYAEVFGDPLPVLRVEQIKTLPAVKDVAAERSSWVWTPPTMKWNLEHTRAVGIPGPVLLSVQASYFSVRGATLAEGRFFGTGEHNVDVAVIGAKASSDFGWSVGDVISWPGIRSKYTIIGRLEPIEATEDVTNGDPHGLGMDDLILVPFDNPPIVDPSAYDHPQDTEYFNRNYAYWVKLRPGMQNEGTEQVSAFLKSLAPPGGGAFAFPHSTDSPLMVAGENFASSFEVITIVIFVVSAITFSAVFLARITSRAKEIGIRRAIGMSGRRAFLEVVGEAFLLSALGTALATLGFRLSHRLFGIPAIPIAKLKMLILSSVLLGPVGVLGPAEIAARISPMSSIRDELAWGSQKRRIDLRQAYALVALGLAVATVCFASSLGLSTVSEVDRQLRACGVHDIEVKSTAESSAEVGQMQYDQLRDALPPDTPMALVQRSIASTWSPDGATWSGVDLIGCDGDVEGALGFTCAAGRADGLGADEVVLGSKLAPMLGGDTAVGKSVKVGPGGRSLRVVGVLQPRPKNVADRGMDRDKAILLSRTGLLEVASPIDSLAKIVIRCANQDGSESVKTLAGHVLGDSYEAVKPFGSLQALRAMQVRFTSCILLGSVALSLSVAIAVGIIMIIRIWETRRSMAIQIAVGSTSHQVALSSAADMLTVTLASTGVGMALGLVGFVAYVQTRKLPLQIGVGGALVTATIGVLIAGVLGAVGYFHFRGKSVAQYLHD